VLILGAHIGPPAPVQQVARQEIEKADRGPFNCDACECANRGKRCLFAVLVMTLRAHQANRKFKLQVKRVAPRLKFHHPSTYSRLDARSRLKALLSH
jgi:hypothetical protein